MACTQQSGKPGQERSESIRFRSTDGSLSSGERIALRLQRTATSPGITLVLSGGRWLPCLLALCLSFLIGGSAGPWIASRLVHALGWSDTSQRQPSRIGTWERSPLGLIGQEMARTSSAQLIASSRGSCENSASQSTQNSARTVNRCSGSSNSRDGARHMSTSTIQAGFRGNLHQFNGQTASKTHQSSGLERNLNEFAADGTEYLRMRANMRPRSLMKPEKASKKKYLMTSRDLVGSGGYGVVACVVRAT